MRLQLDFAAQVRAATRRANLLAANTLQQTVSGLVAAMALRDDWGRGERCQRRSALDLLEARAQFDGPERAVHVRTAEHAERLYLGCRP